MKPRNLKSNKGFTLVELLIGFALFGIICTAIVGFIAMSTRSYRRTSDIINLQIEYQIVMNMLNEYIINSDGDIKFDADKLTIDDTYVFSFDRTNQRLYLGEIGDALVSRNITEFDVKHKKSNLIAVEMHFQPSTRDRTYSATQLIALRNPPAGGA